MALESDSNAASISMVAFLFSRTLREGCWTQGHRCRSGRMVPCSVLISPDRGEIMRAKAEWAEEVRVERVRAMQVLDKLAYQTYNYCTQQGALNCGEKIAKDYA